MLLQQGLDDRVVPPDQAREMAAAVAAKGLPVALVMYEGEGHGFRRADTITASLNAKLSFLGQVFGFVPAGDVPVLAIANLPADKAIS
jgi:dipeptidyl aminopeptidase/acylaminoacyl peptidase